MMVNAVWWIFAVRLADISDILMAGISPQPTGVEENQTCPILVCMWMLMDIGRLLNAVRRKPAFVWNLPVGLMYILMKIILMVMVSMLTSLSLTFADVAPTESSSFPGLCPEYSDIHSRMMKRYSWLPFKGYCYLFLKEKVEWPAASASCARHGKEFLLMV